MNLDRITTARRWAGTGAIWHAAMCLAVLCMGSVAAAAGVEDVTGNVATEESVAESSGELSGDAYDDDIVLDPQRCVRRVDIDHTKIVDDRAILFYMRGSTIFLNKLPHRCSGLKMAGAFGYDTRTGQLCDIDVISVVDHIGGGLRRGVSCGLGKFKPITEEQVELIKEIGTGDF